MGPNGAGKTTTIKVLTGLAFPDSGEVRVLGLDPHRDGRRLRRQMGVVQQDPSYDVTLTVRQNLQVYAALWGLTRQEASARISEVVELFDLTSLLDRRVSFLSGGQRRRLQVAREFLHDTRILFLDEPTAGLDPAMRRAFLDFILQRHKAKGMTILWTSHNLEEVQYVCQRVAIMREGTILVEDSVDRLRARYSPSPPASAARGRLPAIGARRAVPVT